MSVVVDTSAVLAVIGNESHRPRLLELTLDQELVAPPTLPWEIANALSARFKRRAATMDTANAVLDLFAAMPIRVIDVDLATVVALSATLNVYAYDACMIACALKAGAPLLTLDGGLRDAARRAGVAMLEVNP